jgi:hypothetical protein
MMNTKPLLLPSFLPTTTTFTGSNFMRVYGNKNVEKTFFDPFPENSKIAVGRG